MFVRSFLRSKVSLRTYSSRALFNSKLPDHYKYGPGGKPGKIPDDMEQATGPERIEMISNLQGEDPYDMSVTALEKKGTEKNPIIVKSLGMSDRVVGCSGVKDDGHDIVWIFLEGKEIRRCTECGNAFRLDDLVGTDDHGH
eukprot:NODE_101_length_20473_cov_0.516590.p8 type:complete len:141 gc:universal NODE_101_length_20473_cov_0.516590:1765-2187(+)